MHPTQHSTIPSRRELPILRIHRRITQGVSEEQADGIVTAAAQQLQSLSKSPPQPPKVNSAPAAKPSLHELLSQASHAAQAFTPRRPTLNSEVA